MDRYGGETGKFVSPKGTPYTNRSLPPGSDARPYNVYEVVKPIDVQSGKNSLLVWISRRRYTVPVSSIDKRTDKVRTFKEVAIVMWKFVKSGIEGDCELFGANIFDYRWEPQIKR